MDKDLIYTITEEGNSIIKPEIDNFNSWLSSLSNKELSKFQEICSKKMSEWSEENEFIIFKYALLIYCRELGISEISLNEEFLNKINKLFSAGVLLEGLRREGFIEYKTEILLYKDSEIKLTEKGKKTSKTKKYDEN